MQPPSGISSRLWWRTAALWFGSVYLAAAAIGVAAGAIPGVGSVPGLAGGPVSTPRGMTGVAVAVVGLVVVLASRSRYALKVGLVVAVLTTAGGFAALGMLAG